MATNTTPCRTFTFYHAYLGESIWPMTGIITPDNVVQFRAVPYATIPARFKQSVVSESLSEHDRQFTKHGYACPQTFPDSLSSGGPFPGAVLRVGDELECLILQLNVPLACLHSSPPISKLPLLVYIHGGGFVLGQIDKEHNTALMVEQSISNAQPIISASIQYRLGALGYLHTPEPENANIALNDQRSALIWLQRFVGGFGGDSGKVTLFGESGGAMSICSHILAQPPPTGPLFQRVILMSGVLGPMTAPLSIGEADKLYEKFLSKADVKERGEAGLHKLRELDVETIVETTAELSGDSAMFLPVLDQEWFGPNIDTITWDKLPELISKCDWIDKIVLGTTGFEGTTFMARAADISPKEWLAGITEQLGEENAELLGHAYNITSDMDQNLFVTAACRWVGDVIFEAPIHEWAKYLTTHTNKKVYRYVFDVRNPFPGSSLYQQAHHWVDKYYVFKTLQFRYPTHRLKEISTKHAQLWIDFANGKAPWTEYKYTGHGNEVIMVADEREGWVERTVAEHEKIMELTWKTSEALMASWKNEKGKSFLPMDIAPLRGKSLV